MGGIAAAYVFPHPPLAVPGVGKGSEKGAQKTIDAMVRAAESIRKDNPDTIIVTTPHGPVFQDFIYINTSKRLAGDLSRFGDRNTRLEFENNLDLVQRIINRAQKEGLPAGGLDDSIARKFHISGELDHGVLVPLYFVSNVLKNVKLVQISIAGLPFEELYKFGICIGKAAEETEGKTVFIASGDLSHRLSKDSPYEYSPKGREFDNLVVEAFKNLDVEKLLTLKESFCEEAGECGLRSFLMMFGALDGYELKSEVYSYEGPFGVGYSVASFNVLGKNDSDSVLKRVREKYFHEIEKIREAEDFRVRLARLALEEYVRNKKVIKIPDWIPDELLNEKAGVFVSIKKQGQLRGCIGTIAPTRKNIAEEIIYNAISSGTRDGRFYPVEEEELDKLIYSVDILKEPEPIRSIDELDVKKYGVIVRSGYRTGLLLPNLEGINTPEEQVEIALKKAGIKPHEKFDMERFEVVRYK
ncbi:MAG TPA: AmmeMemoRadiSam system protein A [Clostridiaceae bacterium]|nr:AmmeMemoRadiSam system protein A [Clostridiaceae bacterium]